jgi:hypothetical protein
MEAFNTSKEQSQNETVPSLPESSAPATNSSKDCQCDRTQGADKTGRWRRADEASKDTAAGT